MSVADDLPVVGAQGLKLVSTSESETVVLRRTVLVVDDYPAVLAWASRAFERVGWRILTATDSVDALALFDDAATSGEPVDLLITDLQLETVSGADLVRHLRRLKPTLPVIALFTGSAPDNDWHGAMLDHTSFFQKPVRAGTLLAAADALVLVPGSVDDEPCPHESM